MVSVKNNLPDLRTGILLLDFTGLVFKQHTAALSLRALDVPFIFPGQNTRRPQINVFFQ